MKIYAILFILAMLPAVLPTWRSTWIAAGVLYLLLTLAFGWSIHQISTMNNVEGPAFVGIVMAYGFAKGVLVFSCLFKAFVVFILFRR